MASPPFHLYLGLTPRSRKFNLRKRMIRNAGYNAGEGLCTRIPFLKKMLCGQEAADGESARSRGLLKEGKEGDIREMKLDWAFYLRGGRFYRENARFNSYHAGRGLQAVPVHLDESRCARFRVCRCEIFYAADLKLARVLEDRPELALGGGGMFNPPLFEIFLMKEQKDYSWSHTVAHEMEHAVHLSLWQMAGLPFFLMDTQDAEYLAMLRTLKDLGEAPQLLAWKNDYFSTILKNDPDRVPHDSAAVSFVDALLGKYRMSAREVAMGIAWSVRETIEQSLDNSCPAQLERIRKAAADEYHRTYKRLFGLPLEDIRDVIASLPMI